MPTNKQIAKAWALACKTDEVKLSLQPAKKCTTSLDFGPVSNSITSLKVLSTNSDIIVKKIYIPGTVFSNNNQKVDIEISTKLTIDTNLNTEIQVYGIPCIYGKDTTYLKKVYPISITVRGYPAISAGKFEYDTTRKNFHIKGELLATSNTTYKVNDVVAIKFKCIDKTNSGLAIIRDITLAEDNRFVNNANIFYLQLTEPNVMVKVDSCTINATLIYNIIDGSNIVQVTSQLNMKIPTYIFNEHANMAIINLADTTITDKTIIGYLKKLGFANQDSVLATIKLNTNNFTKITGIANIGNGKFSPIGNGFIINRNSTADPTQSQAN